MKTYSILFFLTATIFMNPLRANSGQSFNSGRFVVEIINVWVTGADGQTTDEVQEGERFRVYITAQNTGTDALDSYVKVEVRRGRRIVSRGETDHDLLPSSSMGLSSGSAYPCSTGGFSLSEPGVYTVVATLCGANSSMYRDVRVVRSTTLVCKSRATQHHKPSPAQPQHNSHKHKPNHSQAFMNITTPSGAGVSIPLSKKDAQLLRSIQASEEIGKMFNRNRRKPSRRPAPSPPQIQDTSADSSITWQFENLTNKEIDIEFYSLDREGHAWPGNGRVYFMPRKKLFKNVERHFKIDGLYGERVCFSAWVTGDSSTYWGCERGAPDTSTEYHTCSGVKTRYYRLTLSD